MKKNLLPWQLLTLVALLLPSLYLAYAWAALPALVPAHFGPDGHIDGYIGRNQLWLFTLALPLGVTLLFAVLPRLDPKRQLDSNNVNFQKLRLAVVTMLGGLAGYLIYLGLHPGTPAGRGLALLLGLFFAVLGNYLTTVQPNYFVGIRTPWTLDSPAVWGRTHRVGGMLLCVSGLLIAGLALLLPLAWTMPVLLMLILGTTAFCYAYSYLVFRQRTTLREPV